MTIPQHLKRLWAFIAIAAVAIITYSNALRSEFLMDDLWMFQPDRIAYVKAQVESVVLNKPIPENLKDFMIDLSYRPLSQILPLANYLLFKNNVLGYHIVNLILFILCALMIFLFLQTLFDDFFISLTAALLFAVHPINSLMVNYISAHIFSVQLFLMMASCLSFLHYHRNSKISLLIVSLLTFYLATLCHEMALMLPCFLTWLAATSLKSDIKTTIKKLLPFYILGLLLFVQWFIKQSTTHELFLYQDKLQISWPAYIAGLMQLWTWYVTKLIFLQDVFLMYVLPVKKISLIYGWSLLVAVSALMIFTRRIWLKDQDLVWGLGWFAIGLSSVVIGARFQPAYGLTIEPHWLYFGSIGLFFIAAKGLKRFVAYNRFLPLILIFILMIACSLTTRQLNTIWADNVRYGEYFMTGNPEFEKARLFLANAYFRRGLFQEAERLYQQSFKNIPSDWMPYNNLGVIAEINGRYEEAAGYYQKLLSDHPHDPGILNNLASVYTKMGKFEDAEMLLQDAIASNPWMLLPRINLAVLYDKQNRTEDAIKALEENLKISPDDAQTNQVIQDFRLKLSHSAAPQS